MRVGVVLKDTGKILSEIDTKQNAQIAHIENQITALKQDDKKTAGLDARLSEFESKIETLTNIKASQIRNQVDSQIIHLEQKVQITERKVAEQTAQISMQRVDNEKIQSTIDSIGQF